MNHFDLNTLDVRTQNLNAAGTVTADSTPLVASAVLATIASVGAVYSVVTGTSKRCP
ncbi:hypothetical protein [Deinococcus hopiensis]|uniref:Uncharacterized protein n=1 Tax=Deinococcus hopiensis KR-140 TaxID=695939 RepID=A0A1W1UL88_9DEIO|nr:hypothetical protein [Deinococcus hopiensis]SMB81856.1 hypothetical protein SAMN00790413_04746 [Deinococcus hopiensis KR-140]